MTKSDLYQHIGDMKMRISTGQEIRKRKVLKDLNNYLKAVPESSTLIILKIPQIPKQATK